jgi:hypothetical protein
MEDEKFIRRTLAQFLHFIERVLQSGHEYAPKNGTVGEFFENIVAAAH